MNYKLLLLLLLIPFSYNAQTSKVKAKIINPGSLYSTYDFEADGALLKPAIKLQGRSNIQADIIKYSNQSNWPSGMQELDSRLANKASIMNYTVYKIVAIGDYCILLVPASENKHMEAKLRPANDIYFIMETIGVEYEGNKAKAQAEQVETIDDVSVDDGIKATIINPGDLYSTFSFSTNEYARDMLINIAELSEEEFAEVASLATETGWPSGISDLSARLAAKETMKKYFTYYIGDFGENDEYTLIWIPLEENAHMPKNMQPLDERGFYFVLKAEGVELDD